MHKIVYQMIPSHPDNKLSNPIRFRPDSVASHLYARFAAIRVPTVYRIIKSISRLRVRPAEVSRKKSVFVDTVRVIMSFNHANPWNNINIITKMGIERRTTLYCAPTLLSHYVTTFSTFIILCFNIYVIYSAQSEALHLLLVVAHPRTTQS